jgi:hypothetical protein
MIVNCALPAAVSRSMGAGILRSKHPRGPNPFESTMFSALSSSPSHDPRRDVMTGMPFARMFSNRLGFLHIPAGGLHAPTELASENALRCQGMMRSVQ